MASGSRVVRRSRAVIRSRSSAAALRLKVSTSTRSGSRPRRSIRSATAATMVVVLPVPGPASTSRGPPPWSTTACCASSRRAAGAVGTGRRTRRYAGAWACSITVDSSRCHRHFAVVPSDLQARGVGVQDWGSWQLSTREIWIRLSGNILLVLPFKGNLKTGPREAAGEGRAASLVRNGAGQRLSGPTPTSGRSRAMTATPVPEGTTSRLPPPSPNGSAPPPPPAAPQAPPGRPERTRISGMRTGLIAGAVALIVVMIFVIQNAHAVDIAFLGAHLHLSLAVALLLAAIAGALAMAAAGTARITQLRRIMRRNRRHPQAG